MLLAAMYAVCADPGSASRHLSSKYRAAYKAAEARVAKFAAEPAPSASATLWSLLSELVQTGHSEIRPESTVNTVTSTDRLAERETPLHEALAQRPPPVRA